MSGWTWLPLLAVVYIATAPAKSFLTGWSGSIGGPGFLVYHQGDRFIPASDSGGYEPDEQWWAGVYLEQRIGRLGARAKATCVINQMPSGIPESRPEYLAGLRALLIDRVQRAALYDLTRRHNDLPDLINQIEVIWIEQIRTGSAVYVEIPGPLRYRLAWRGLQVVRILAWSMAALSIVYTAVRWMQISAYKRMLRRHESGHCPDCNYEIAAHPDAVCPECGCDHRARRQEAIAALHRAKQWPLEGKYP